MQRDLTQLMDEIENLYEQAQDVPPLEDEDGIVRIRLINLAIKRWAQDDNTWWAELERDAVITFEDGVAKLPDDFMALGAITTSDGRKEFKATSRKRFLKAPQKDTFIFAGDAGRGYTLSTTEAALLGEITRQNDELVITYQKKPDLLEEALDTPEMSNPDYIVYYVVAELFAQDDTTLYTKYMNDALNILANMREKNASLDVGLYDNYSADLEGLG